MRRFLLLLLIIALLPLPALCESGADRLANLPILSQRDPRLMDDEYHYMGMYFRIGGCKPASVINSLIALLGTSDTDELHLVKEIRKGMAFQSDSSIDMFRMKDWLTNPRESATELRTMLRQVTRIEFIDAARQDVTPRTVISRSVPNADDHPLIIREMAVETNWEWVIDMAAELCRQGHPDARFVLSTVGAGTDETNAPFRYGNSGHYITLYFQAEEFHQEGTFYLLDSVPRALEGDIHGYFEHYPTRYAFVSEYFRDFSKLYTAARITDPVLQFRLREDAQTKLSGLTSGTPAWKQLRLSQMKPVIVYDKAYFMLYIP